MNKLNNNDLEKIVGGVYCSIFDIGCLGLGTLKQIGGMVSSGPTRPTVCIPKSSWNPAPAVPCP